MVLAGNRPSLLCIHSVRYFHCVLVMVLNNRGIWQQLRMVIVPLHGLQQQTRYLREMWG